MPSSVQVIARDITLRKNAQITQSFLAVRDRTTRLLNAAGFREVLDHRVELARRSSKGFPLLFITLENLDGILAELGWLEAESVAKAIANLLRRTLRKSDVIARLRPEEFAVIAPEADEDQEEVLGSRIRAQLDSMNHLSARPVIRMRSAYYDPQFPVEAEALLQDRSDGLVPETPPKTAPKSR
jgi:diguanylate cyclase (GGDEF)-like protein